MPPHPNQVKSRQPGAYADGGDLYLMVREGGDRQFALGDDGANFNRPMRSVKTARADAKSLKRI